MLKKTPEWLRNKESTYIASHIHIIRRLRIRPDHAIRGEMRLHARRLPCEDDSAILRWASEIRPSYGRGVADYLGTFDQVLKRLRRL